jgi:cation transport ATPase
MASVAASVVLMSETLIKLPAAIKLCRETRFIIQQNIAFSVLTKIIAGVLAIIGMF